MKTAYPTASISRQKSPKPSASFEPAKRRRIDAFTIIELMIAVAIVSLLAATAVASFTRYQFEAKMTEVPMMFDVMATAQMTHRMRPRGDEEGCFVIHGYGPWDHVFVGGPDGRKRPYRIAGTGGALHAELLGLPDGEPLAFMYSVVPANETYYGNPAGFLSSWLTGRMSHKCVSHGFAGFLPSNIMPYNGVGENGLRIFAAGDLDDDGNHSHLRLHILQIETASGLQIMRGDIERLNTHY